MTDAFAPWLDRWDLVPDGAPIRTASAHLLPVRHQGRPAMLKLAPGPDQQRGAALMAWWAGDGAARVLAHQAEALLMTRAPHPQALTELAQDGQDDQASRILCRVAAGLHRPRPQPRPALMPLPRWFRDLQPAAEAHVGILTDSLASARMLLRHPQEPVVLHGDLHHGNVLDFRESGSPDWRAIDPQGLIGERGFDFVALFSNPDLADPGRPLTLNRFQRRLHLVSEAARLDRQRLLHWILAGAGLSAAWFLQDNDPLAALPLDVARLAAAELAR